MHSPYSIHTDYEAKVQRLAKDYRAAREMNAQIARMIHLIARIAAAMLRTLSHALSFDSSNRTMQPDPS